MLGNEDKLILIAGRFRKIFSQLRWFIIRLSKYVFLCEIFS